MKKHVFIDQTNGSDRTGDGTANMPYRTVERAFKDGSIGTTIFNIKETQGTGPPIVFRPYSTV